MTWVWLVLLYGIFKGFREGIKKKAVEKSGVMEVLFLYTALALAMTAPFSGNIFGMPPLYFLWIFLKSLVIFAAWIFAFRSVREMPVSLYGVMDMARVVFSTLLGVFVLQESMGRFQILGLALVIGGLLLAALWRRGGQEAPVRRGILLMVLASCVLNAVSGLMDKLLMRTGEITAGQLQFWYMLFLTLLYLLYLVVSRTPVHLRTLRDNGWITLLAVLFVVADRALFVANADPASRVTVMTLIKQSSVLVTILTGKFLFHETHLWRRMAAALVVMAGILLSVLG